MLPVGAEETLALLLPLPSHLLPGLHWPTNRSQGPEGVCLPPGEQSRWEAGDGPQGQTTESCRGCISKTPLIVCGTRRWLSKLRALQKHSGDFSFTSGILSISGKVHSSSPCILLSNRRTPGNDKRRLTMHLLEGRHPSKPLIIASPDTGSWVRWGPGPGSSKGRSGPLGPRRTESSGACPSHRRQAVTTQIGAEGVGGRDPHLHPHPANHSGPAVHPLSTAVGTP